MAEKTKKEALMLGISTLGALGEFSLSKRASKHDIADFKLKRQLEKWQSYQRLRSSLAQGIQTQADFLSQQAVSGAGLGSSGTQGQMSAYSTQMRLGVKEYEGQEQLMDKRAKEMIGAAKARQSASAISTFAETAVKLIGFFV